MKTYKARGIVLHTVKYGESGLVAYLYTDVAGRRTYMVDGVRSSRGKGNRGALFQPMFVLEFEGVEPRLGEMHRMKDAAAAVPFLSIPFDLRKSTIALFMAEVVYRLIREPEPDGRLYDFIAAAVESLDAMDRGVANFHLWFLLKLSWFLGFYPGNSYSAGDLFDIAQGTFVDAAPEHGMFMDEADSELLGALMETPPDTLHTIALSRERRVRFLNAMLSFIGYHSDTIHSVRSMDILREVF